MHKLEQTLNYSGFYIRKVSTLKYMISFKDPVVCLELSVPDKPNQQLL